MRHQLSFDGRRAAARLAALAIAVALLVVVGAIRNQGSTQDQRSVAPASRVARGMPGLFLLGESSQR